MAFFQIIQICYLGGMMIYDLLVIGGGINGAGIACDAAGRGLSVYLCEKNDFGSGTSSKSSRLIHGGLRYLEQFYLRLVRKSLKEREVLLKKAPYLIVPQAFIIPHAPALRPWWKMRLGLWIYDNLAHHTLPDSSGDVSAIDLSPLKKHFNRGFKYYDCFVDDARLVIANVLQAHQLGAKVENYMECQALHFDGTLWTVQLQNRLNHQRQILKAKVIINAAGPDADKVREYITGKKTSHLQLIKGSHIVFKKQYEGEQAYLLQTDDHRVIFVIPDQENMIVGTTEVSVESNHVAQHISEDEIHYLLKQVNRYWAYPLERADIIHTYAGVRPLFDVGIQNFSKINRDYKLDTTYPNCIHVYGGKLTTYRQLSETVVDKLKLFFPELKLRWTASASLPGGDKGDVNSLIQHFQHQFDWLPVLLYRRYLKQYGSCISVLLRDCHQLGDLGVCFGADLYEKEVTYLMQYEFAKTTDDILWRRTKLGLSFSQDETAILAAAIAAAETGVLTGTPVSERKYLL